MDFIYQLVEFDDGSSGLMKVGGMVSGAMVAPGKSVIATHDLDISEDTYQAMRQIMATHDVKYDPHNKHFSYIKRTNSTPPTVQPGHPPDHS